MSAKFDNVDRKHAIEAVEKIHGIRLKRVGRRYIYLRSESDARYVVLGGNDDWHGIPDDVIEDAETATEKHLVVAIKGIQSLKLYECDLGLLLQHRAKLSRPGGNKYTFNIDEKLAGAKIRQAPAVSLSLLTEIEHTEADRASTVREDSALKKIKAMSKEEREELLRQLQEGGL